MPLTPTLSRKRERGLFFVGASLLANPGKGDSRPVFAGFASKLAPTKNKKQKTKNKKQKANATAAQTSPLSRVRERGRG
jgi:hypothetical protein